MNRLAFVLAVTVITAGPVTAETGQEIIAASGVRGGLVVHVGCGDGELTAELRINNSYIVQGLDADSTQVVQARKNIQSLGLYGQVTAATFDGVHLPYIDSVVNLVAAEDIGRVPLDEVMRVLCPEGVALIRRADRWTKTIKSRPREMDDWTHFLHDADGNAVANDTMVSTPYHLQWVAGPRYARTHEGVSTVNVAVSDGRRIYYIADDATTALPEQLPTKWVLATRDAFNGILLWKRPLRVWQARSAGSRHLFPPDLFRRLVAGDQHVYATLSIFGPVSALDPSSGETVHVYKDTEKTEEILCDKGILYLVVNPAPRETIDRRQLAEILSVTGPKRLMAIHADTSRVLWAKNDADTMSLVPMSTAVRDENLVFQNPREIVCVDAETGHVRWRTSRLSPQARPVWGTPTVVIADDVVLSADRKAPAKDGGTVKDLKKARSRSELIAYDLKTGRELWRTPTEEGSHVPNELFVVDDIVWAGEQPSRGRRDYTVGRDIHTGRVKVTLPEVDGWVSHHHHRCYRDKATSRFILAGRTGVEFIDLKSGQLAPHHWIRGICKFGVLPCNGLLYVPPNQCSCYQESLLNGFNALAPKSTSRAHMTATSNTGRLQKGPAYGQIENSKPVLNAAEGSKTENPHDWPTYRGNAARTGSTAGSVPLRLGKSWQTEITGRLTAPVIAAGRVYVAAIDRHTVHALDSGSGTTLWRFTADGRVDSPPTVARGLVVFGCRDGWVYALRAADGDLVWRYRAAPRNRRLVADGQCESVWPVHGSVLIEDGRVYFAAGRYSHLDGGVVCSVVDLMTGERLAEQRHYSRDAESGGQKSLYEPFAGALLPDRELPGVLPDVPSSNGEFVFMRSVAFDHSFKPANRYVQHLFAAAGFVDDAWYQRLFWIFGNHQFSGLAGRGFNKGFPSAGRILVHDETTLYGYRDYTLDDEGVFAIEKNPLLGVFDSKFPPAKKKLKSSRARAKPETLGTVRWDLDVPFYVRAMLCTSNALLLAGPPKHEPQAAHKMIATGALDTDPLPPLLNTALAAWKGERGGRLWIVDKKNGARLVEYELDSPPVHDGMAAAHGRLYVSGMDGVISCFARSRK